MATENTGTQPKSYSSYTEGFDIKNILSGNLRNETNRSDVKVIDKDWVQSRFIVADKDLHSYHANDRYLTTASNKFTDTSLGGNITINPRPQFTRYCDIRDRGRIRGRNPVTLHKATMQSALGSGVGMGRYYSEAIDDNQQTVFLEFGVAKFNSMLSYFTNAVDYADTVVANTGRIPYLYNLGSFFGSMVMLAAFPLITMSIWFLKSAYGLFMGANSFKYYYLEQTMPMYWGVANTILSQIAVELGFLNPIFMKEGRNGDEPVESTRNANPLENTIEQLTGKSVPGIGDTNEEAGMWSERKIGVKQRIDQGDIKDFDALFPGLINTSTNYIDIFAIATRAQAIANKQMFLEYKAKERRNYLIDIKSSKITDETAKALLENTKENFGFFESANHYFTFKQYITSNNTGILKREPGDASTKEHNMKSKTPDVKPDTAVSKEGDTVVDPNAETKRNIVQSVRSEIKATTDSEGRRTVQAEQGTDNWFQRAVTAMDSDVRQGGAFAVFAVDFTGSVSESFSNSSTTISTGESVKEMSKKARNVKFNLSGGKVIGGVDKVIGGVVDLLAGVLDGVTYGLSNVISTMMGGAYIEVPKRWDDSDMSLPSITYNMQLVSPYGNTISQLQNIYIPLSMLLAGTLPLATGKTSYTSPFLCSIFSKGVQRVQLGMISSLSISRGVSNLAFDKSRRPLALDISFQVSDFSTLITSPVNSSVFNIEGIFSFSTEDDTPLGNYISVLGGRDLLSNKYASRRFRLKASKAIMNVSQAFSSAAMGMRMGDKLDRIIGPLVSVRTLTSAHHN